MNNHYYQFVILFIIYRCLYSLLILEHTLDQSRSYKDCFIDPTVYNELTNDYIYYCLRLDNLINESWSNTCYTGDQITFKELSMRNVIADDLIQWQIPLDLADFYGVFLENSLYENSMEFICNCSLENQFGRYCEYSFKEGISTIEELINSSIEDKKKFYPKERLLPCYKLEIDSEKRCLDYRDICDGEFDTMNGEDEFYCDLIEMNSCTENQFRCRNGLCIDRQFLFDGQGDCSDFSDEQNSIMQKKYKNFKNCYEKSTFDCDEHWCGREMISCGDGECLPWFQRFWGENDCQNSYTHVYNCELEERQNKTIDFSITNNNGRCITNITEFNNTDDQCLLLIKCAITLHPTCLSQGIIVNNSYDDAITYAYQLCQNRTKINYASGANFLSPFIRAYYKPVQLKVTTTLEFFALMNIRIPGLFCLIGERICQDIKIIHNGSLCFNYSDIFDKNYPFPPYDYLFCKTEDHFIDLCLNTSFFYRCQTTGECISKYRLFDGFPDCLDSSDETNFEILHSLEVFFLKDRYNCTFKNSNNFTAIMRHFLGDEINHCKDGTDEMSLTINWQRQQCFNSDDYSCHLLRNLYNGNKNEEFIQIIPFKSLCDSIWDLRNGADEIDCHEWICETNWIKQENNRSRWSGNCIDPLWKCNNIWDSYDGSDEYNCNYTEKYPIPHCLLLKTKEIILLNQSNEIAGNDDIDCLGGIDERVTFACKDGFPLNNRFLCNDQITCLEPMNLCNHILNCPNGEDEDIYWCGIKHSLNTSICSPKSFDCQEQNNSGPCIPQEDRCHEERHSCLISHRDDHMCIQSRQNNRIILEKIPAPQMQQSQSILVPPWYCDRGLVVYRYGQIVCLCPPSFSGYRCEKHTHRLTIIFTLNRTFIEDDLIRINILLIHQNEIIDQILLTQESSSHLKKHRIYLNYPQYLYSDLRNNSKNYHVEFQLYLINNNTIRLTNISKYYINYSFLPAFRLTVVLKYEKRSFINQELNKINHSCAPGSLLSIVGNEHIICICTSNQYGPTCHLKTIPCSSNYCQYQTNCISYKDKFHNIQFRCLCSDDHFGEHCQYNKTILSLNLHDETFTQSKVFLIELIDYDSTKMHLNIKESQFMSKNSLELSYNDVQLPSIGLLKVYEFNVLNIYLLYIGENSYSYMYLTEQNKTRCKYIEEFNLNSSNKILSTIKHYHRPCQDLKTNMTTICFYDFHTYFCFCNEKTHRASCYLYEFKSDHCYQCINGGQCIRGKKQWKNHIHCLCPPCYFGDRCEFSSEAFSFTLDSLIVHDSFTIQMIYLCLTTAFFIIGLFTNACSIVTFKRPNPRKYGVGNYLFVAAILNQLALFFLVVKVLSVILGTIGIVHTFSCKSIAYFLSVTTRTNYWLTTWITIERLIIIPFPTFTTLRNPNVAIIIIIITLLSVLTMHFHEIISYKVIDYSSLCIPMFQSSRISLYNQITLILHHLIPFLVQVFAITLLIILAAQSRARSVGRKTTFSHALKKQFHIHKELYFSPAIIVLILSILPQGILSFKTVCTELQHWQRYILLITYFLSYLPQILGFILQVLLSSGYTTEFKETSIGKHRFFQWMLTSKSKKQIRKNIINLAIVSTGLHRIEEQTEQASENAINFMTTSL